ncbi:MAG: amidohydrolase [Bacteroidaceae bacterium]|nr:amidohydrolase [Bacteroidaceae bacterium]
MRITVLQHDIAWMKPDESLSHLDSLMQELPPCDVCLLAEMFPTGFCTEPAQSAQPAPDGPALGWMRQKARQMDAAVAGSVAVTENGRYYNRFYFVRPDGSVTQYDKRHLFAYGGEDHAYTPGRERVVAEFRGVRFLLMTCFDLRFPAWSAFRGDYDVILYAANWPTQRRLAWQTLLRARAIENQCYVAGANRVGSDPQCHYSGDSAIIHPYGHELAACKPGHEDCATADIDIEALREFRRKFPVLSND